MAALAAAVFLFVSAAGAVAVAADRYYPGPEPGGDTPITIVTPDPVRPQPDNPSEPSKPQPNVTPEPAKPQPDVTPTSEPPKPVVPTKTPAPVITAAPVVPNPTATPVPGEEEEVNPEYTVTIIYQYITGQEAANPYVQTYHEGDTYGVHSPEITGYQVSKDMVSGIVPKRDVCVVVYYIGGDSDFGGFSILEIIEDYETPLGLGNVVINIGDCYE